jgi:hypothetical protein
VATAFDPQHALVGLPSRSWILGMFGHIAIVPQCTSSTGALTWEGQHAFPPGAIQLPRRGWLRG